jgi:hypothetical protein
MSLYFASFPTTSLSHIISALVVVLFDMHNTRRRKLMFDIQVPTYVPYELTLGGFNGTDGKVGPKHHIWKRTGPI